MNKIFAALAGFCAGTVIVVSVFNLFSGNIFAGLVGLALSFTTAYVVYRTGKY